MTPGTQLHRLARRLCGPALSDRVFEPLLADLQQEWRDTPPGVRRGLALARGYAAFWQALAFSGIRAAAAEALRPPTRDVQVSALGALTLSTAAVVLLQLIAVGLEPQGAAGQAPVVVWWIIFNTATTTLPLALLPIAFRARVTQARRADAVKLAIAGAVLTVGMNAAVAPWAEGHHIAAVGAHRIEVDSATRARAHPDRYAWAVVPRADSVPEGWPTSIAGRAALALAVAWLGWSIGRPRQQRFGAVAGCWFVVLLLLNVHHEAEPAFQIWQRAMMLVIAAVLIRQAQHRAADA